MFTKTRWFDKEAPISIKEAFTEFGKKIDFNNGDIIVDKNYKNDSFYFVKEGLLTALEYGLGNKDGEIVKFLPTSRIFGYTNFFCGENRNYQLVALRDSSVYKLSYNCVEYLMQKGYFSKRLFKFCGKRAIETKHATLAAIRFMKNDNLPWTIGAALAATKDFDEYGRYRKIVDLSTDEILGLQHIGKKRKKFRMDKEKVIRFI